jgi:hypothetical protein
MRFDRFQFYWQCRRLRPRDRHQLQQPEKLDEIVRNFQFLE